LKTNLEIPAGTWPHSEFCGMRQSIIWALGLQGIIQANRKHRRISSNAMMDYASANPDAKFSVMSFSSRRHGMAGWVLHGRLCGRFRNLLAGGTRRILTACVGRGELRRGAGSSDFSQRA
jgi:hypothetical protein